MASASRNGAQSRVKDLLGIQLEVTERLLEAEEQKLQQLKTEIDIAKHNREDEALAPAKAKELEMQENTYLRLRTQYQRLSQEMQMIGLIHSRKMKASRSLPAIGMKQTPKKRISLFEHMVSKDELIEAKIQELGPKSPTPTTSSAQMVTSAFSPQQLAEELHYRDGVLIGGTMEGLVQLLVPTERYYPERTFLFAFLLCSRMFIPPHELLSRVSRIFQYLQRQRSDKNVKLGAAIKSIQLLREWTETFPYDFRNERMMKSLKDMTQMQGFTQEFPEMRRDVGQLQSALIQKLSILDRYEHILSQINTVAMQKLVDPQTQIDILRVCDDPTVLAQQLTHIELERLCNIGPEEFIQAFIKSLKDSEEMKKTSNIEAYVEWFNRLSYLVATEICVSDKQRNRVRLMEFFVDVANECRKLNNYNSFMAIAAGLYMSPVVRLKKTRSKVNARKLEELETYLDPSNNFSVYRSAMSSATSGSAERSKTCFIPFFSLLIKDLYFQNESMNNRLPNGMIRFEKCMAMARLVSQILSWKDTVLPYDRKRSVLNYLMTVPIHTDDELQLVSYETEPPENAGEKQRYQQLKGQLGSYARCIGKHGGVTAAFSSHTLAAFPMYRDK